MDTQSIFAVAGPGLEQVVTDELASLGIHATSERGGATWTGPTHDIARANLELRTAARILVRAAAFRARTFHELERRARRVDWSRFVASADRVHLRVTCRKSALYHEGAVAERVLEAIEERTGVRGATARRTDDEDDDMSGQLFVVRLYRDTCTISADTSGELLHRRGYREALAKAPLRETIAAAMLRASGWTAELPLLDPLCGSGTIAIEAALIGRDIAPGLARADRSPRGFRFLEWPETDTAHWSAAVQRAQSRIRPRCPAAIHASDRNAGAIRAATANAARAGVLDDVEFATRPLSATHPVGAAGWIVTNPPYGRRVGSRADASATQLELASRMVTDFEGWHLAVLAPGQGGRGSRHHPGRQPGGPQPAPRPLLETRNGGIPVTLLISEPAG